MTANPFEVAALPVDDELLALSMFLEPGCGGRLRQLLDATTRVRLVVELEHKLQRAEDLANECRRQMRVRDRQCEDLRAAGLDLAQELAAANGQIGAGQTRADLVYTTALRRAAAERRAKEDQ